MNGSFITHTTVDSIDNDFPVLYYHQLYLRSQNHQNLTCYENEHLFLPVSISRNIAISMQRSPFGSFFSKDNIKEDEFHVFFNMVRKDLKNRGVLALKITHPSSIYEGFIPLKWLLNMGFTENYHDINQHIILDAAWYETIHDMQKRKLTTLENEGFRFKKMEANELKIAHQFIEVSRLAQELTINISYDQLKTLFDTTSAYDIFGVFREDKISALCIAVRVTPKVAYYYLPATSPMFRSQSPMVLLIADMVAHYRSQGFSYFDLGVSSINGKPQESLRLFKERMGAVQSEKTSLTMQL